MTLDVSPTLSVWALLKVNLTPSALKPRQSFFPSSWRLTSASFLPVGGAGVHVKPCVQPQIDRERVTSPLPQQQEAEKQGSGRLCEAVT